MISCQTLVAGCLQTLAWRGVSPHVVAGAPAVACSVQKLTRHLGAMVLDVVFDPSGLARLAMILILERAEVSNGRVCHQHIWLYYYLVQHEIT